VYTENQDKGQIIRIKSFVPKIYLLTRVRPFHTDGRTDDRRQRCQGRRVAQMQRVKTTKTGF